jgi:outer membrane protein assembly factor BamB
MYLRARIVVFVLASAAVFAADPVYWSEFRGPQGAGIASTAGPVQFGPKQNLLWSLEVPHGHSSPTIWGDRLFITSFDKASKKFEVIAVDRKNGKIAWRQTVPSEGVEEVHAVSSPATATPVVDAERVYSYFASAGLFCHDHKGKLLWSAPMPVAKATFGSGASPALAGDAIIVPRDDQGERKLIAFDKATGNPLWRKELGGISGPQSGHATPVIWKDQIVLHRMGELVGYSVKDGSRRWWLPVGSGGSSIPVIVGDTLYLAAFGSDPDLRDPFPDWQTLAAKYDTNKDGFVEEAEFPNDLAFLRRTDAGATPGAVITLKKFFKEVDFNKDGKYSEDEWQKILGLLKMTPPVPQGMMAVKLGAEGEIPRTNVLWQDIRGVPEVPSPIHYKDRVYMVTNGGILSVFDAASGKLAYRSRVGAGGLYYSSPIVAADRIYLSSGDGVVTVIKAGDKLEVLAKNDLGEPIFATPALLEGKLYVRTTGHLYGFSAE